MSLADKVIEEYTKAASKKSNTDPNGSYTGVPKDKDERPVQDADDL